MDLNGNLILDLESNKKQQYRQARGHLLWERNESAQTLFLSSDAVTDFTLFANCFAPVKFFLTLMPLFEG